MSKKTKQEIIAILLENQAKSMKTHIINEIDDVVLRRVDANLSSVAWKIFLIPIKVNMKINR